MLIIIIEIAIGIAAYILLRNKLAEKYGMEFIKSVRWMLITPIIQILFFAPVFYASFDAIDGASKAKDIGRLSTWAPLFGEDAVNWVDFAVKNDLISDTQWVDSNPYYQDLLTSALLTNGLAYLSIIVFLIMAFIQFRNIFGEAKERSMRTSNIVACVTCILLTFSVVWFCSNFYNYIYSSKDFGLVAVIVITLIAACILCIFTKKFLNATSVFCEQKEKCSEIVRQEMSQTESGTDTTKSKVEQLQDLKKLVDDGFLTKEEFDNISVPLKWDELNN